MFGILTTYEDLRVLWCEDTNDAALVTCKSSFDERCKSGSANEYFIEGSVLVYMTRVYKYTETSLIELLVSVMYKMSKTPIASPSEFAKNIKKYIFAKEDGSLTYRSLSESLLKTNIKPFKYEMPPLYCSNFYILLY